MLFKGIRYLKNHRRVVVADNLEIKTRFAVAGGPETAFFKTS
jgi:hypothetical protein